MKIKFIIILFVGISATFAVTPAVREFTSGNITIYSSAGHPKSKGLNMQVSYPNSWLAREGKRPNVVQTFFSEGGKGLEGAILLTKDVPNVEGVVFSDSDLAEYFEPSELISYVPPNAKMIQIKSTRIEGCPAGIVEYSQRQERAGMVIDTQFITYMFIFNDTFVQLLCMVSLNPGISNFNISNKMEKFRPLFFLMANSIMLPDKWK